MSWEEKQLEAKINRADKKMRELTLNIQRLSREYEKFLDDLDLTPEQLKIFVESPDSFSEQIRETLEIEKKKMGERLNLQLNNVRNANATQKTFSERGTVQQHWLFVR